MPDRARGTGAHRFRPPSGPAIPGTRSEEAGRFRLDFGPLERAGLGAIDPADGAKPIPVSASPAPDECDLRPLPPEALAGLPAGVLERSPRLDPPSARTGAERTRDVSGRFLWGLAGLLALESALAAWFSRRRVAA